MVELYFHEPLYTSRDWMHGAEPHRSTHRDIVRVPIEGGGRILARFEEHYTDLLLLDGRLLMLFDKSPLAMKLEVESLSSSYREETSQSAGHCCTPYLR